MAQETATEPDKKVRAFFAAAESYCDTQKKKFAAQHGMSMYAADKMLPWVRWDELRREWLLVRVRRATDEVFNECKVRKDFSRERIKRRLRSLGGKGVGVARYVDAEWRSRRMKLPTKEEKAREIVDRLISEGVPANEITVLRLRQELGTSLAPMTVWLVQLIRKAKGQLMALGESSTRQLPEGLTTASSGGGLGTDELDLRDGSSGGLLRRRDLRPDIAEVVWPLLREDALSGQCAVSTIMSKFLGYRKAGELLGAQIPDVAKATLSGIKTIWVGYKDNGNSRKRSVLKAGLIRLFSGLVILSKAQPEIDRREMLFITGWLSITSNFKRVVTGDVLSADELDALIRACLTDVKEGMDFIAEGRDLLNLSTRQINGPNAAPLIRWGVALIILIMFLTGLRRQSVINLKVGDWAEIHPGMFALIWRHGKKHEEHVAVLPTTLAGILNDYAEATRELRNAFGIERLFIVGGTDGYWQMKLPLRSLPRRFGIFVKSHALTRSSKLITINSQIARRTYVTRELYEGQSIWALRLQLGHERLESTLGYGKFDMFEHPAQVGPALDTYGQCALTLWRGPVVLNSLDAAERERLLELRPERDQGVGLCRHGSCKKIDEGPLPPCSMCEHLVTGKEFFGAWDAEKARRESGLVKLEGVPGRESLLSHCRQQYALFTSNYLRLKGESV